MIKYSWVFSLFVIIFIASAQLASAQTTEVSDASIPRARVLKNLMISDASKLTTNVISGTGSCIVTKTEGKAIIDATATGTARCFVFQTVKGLDPNAYYVVGAEVETATGTFQTASMSFVGKISEGKNTLTKTILTPGRFAFTFKPEATTGIIRFGIGVNVNETLESNDDQMVIKNPYLYKVSSLTEAPGEFVSKVGVVSYPMNAQVSSGVVTVTGSSTTPPAYTMGQADAVLIVGDSFCNDSSDYAEKLQTLSNRAVYYSCVAGSNFNAQLTRYQAWLANPTLEKPWHVLPQTVIFGMGINDIIGNASTTTIKARVERLVALATSTGMTPLVLTPTPFGTATSWTPARQSVLEDHRAWVLGNDSFLSLDLYQPFLSSTTPYAMATTSVHGVTKDGLHPVSTGMTYIAELIENKLKELPEIVVTSE
jgi:lysophospholipase L1-like esterase